jgi:hypothetical protein
MFLDWWMIATFAVWWLISVMHISKSSRYAGLVEGVNKGTEQTLTLLESRNIIYVDNEGVIYSGAKE